MSPYKKFWDYLIRFEPKVFLFCNISQLFLFSHTYAAVLEFFSVDSFTYLADRLTNLVRHFGDQNHCSQNYCSNKYSSTHQRSARGCKAHL